MRQRIVSIIIRQSISLSITAERSHDIRAETSNNFVPHSQNQRSAQCGVQNHCSWPSTAMQHRDTMASFALRLFVAAACLALCGLGPASADLPSLSSYAKSFEFDPDYTLYWTADTSAAKPKMSFAVRAQTKGFVAFGLSEVGGMVGSGEMLPLTSSHAPAAPYRQFHLPCFFPLPPPAPPQR